MDFIVFSVRSKGPNRAEKKDYTEKQKPRGKNHAVFDAPRLAFRAVFSYNQRVKNHEKSAFAWTGGPPVRAKITPKTKNPKKALQV